MNSTFPLLLVQAHLLKGDFDLCKQDLQKALSVDPTNSDVRISRIFLVILLF